MALRLSCLLSMIVYMASWQENFFAESLNNGLALTPPMGWMDWERFRCNTDCKNDPDNCIGEKLFMDMATRMAEDGFKDVGYKYVSIDDCWMSHNRTADGQLQPDPSRFPSGMKALADFIHSKGLKLGIYADYGTKTCAGYPGTIDHIQQDMDTFAGWGVDYLKLDGCYSDPDKMDTGYPMVTKALNNTGRPIVFSCSWPAYQSAKKTPNYTWIAENCNLWRNYNDIQDSWQSVTSIVKWYGDHQDEMIPVAGPGNWNDPDMLIIGDFSLSFEQSNRSAMAKSGYRVSFLEPTDRGDGDARAWKVTTEKRWTVAGAKVTTLHEELKQKCQDRSRWTWAGEKVTTLGDELKQREFLLRARRKQSQELFAEALPAAEEALKMYHAVDRRHQESEVKLRAMRSACLSHLQSSLNKLSEKHDLKESLLLSVLKDHGWIEGTEMEWGKVPGHFDPAPDLKAFVKKLRFWGEAEPAPETVDAGEEEDEKEEEEEEEEEDEGSEGER